MDLQPSVTLVEGYRLGVKVAVVSVVAQFCLINFCKSRGQHSSFTRVGEFLLFLRLRMFGSVSIQDRVHKEVGGDRNDERYDLFASPDFITVINHGE
jgi:hypothetical protein